MERCIAVSLGLIDYADALELQATLHAHVVSRAIPNVLLLLEHPHVYTLGRRGSADDILATPEELSRLGVEVHNVDRGGEVTYHGPGQLVGYPIVHLRSLGGGPLKYVHALEEILVATLTEFEIPAESGGHPTGVWVGESKIAAIGVRVSRGVTTHGFALNVNPDLSYFDHIVPCGMSDVEVTSMAVKRSSPIDVGKVIPVLARHFGRVFGWDIEWTNPDELRQKMQPTPPVAAYG